MEQLNELNHLGKLHCTFTDPSNLDETISTINRRYSVIFNKIFVLESPQSDELICTYSIDTGNMSTPMSNTILLHRKKDWNVLYSINALNTLIMSLNGGKIDNRFMVDWQEYKNSILLTSGYDLRKLDTKIHKIFDFN